MASLSSPIPTSPSHPPPSSPSLNSASPLSPSPSPSIHSPRPPPPVRRASTSSDRIPIPGKSILKKPPPPPTGLLSRITSGMKQVVTTTPIAGESSTGGLKRAHFILPEIAVVYPISSNAPPRTPMTDIEKQTIENREKERRKRVVSGEPENGTGWWTMEKVQGFYEECCRAMDVKPDEAISKALLKPSSSLTIPRTLDLTGVSLTTTQAEILADVLSIEWGLRSLILCESNLDPEVLKPILHALLLNNTLIYLSVASNTGLGNKSWVVLEAYLSKSRLKVLDLSRNAIDKKAMEGVVKGGSSSLITLTLDSVILKSGALDVLARAVRTSPTLRTLSLRNCRIGAMGSRGGIAISLMIRDWPDTVAASLSPSPNPSSVSTNSSSNSLSQTSNSGSHPNSHPPLPIPHSHLPPPPPSHSTKNVQTTYTPYVPRSKRGVVAGSGSVPATPTTPMAPMTPTLTTVSRGGVTAVGPVPPSVAALNSASAALLSQVRALDALPRMGNLRSLDLRGNEMRNHITYLAQVLKRNRTLKSLNLQDNKLDPKALAVLAEALKYNAALEELDLGRNPCCGVVGGSIHALRLALALNTTLNRLSLADTHLGDAGAIALAEWMGEYRGLRWLDLTRNSRSGLGEAGVLALAQGVKVNRTLRCLDVEVPPGVEGYARLSREILNTCIRNVEASEREEQEHGGGLVLGDVFNEQPLRLEETDGRSMTKDPIYGARECIKEMKDYLELMDSTPRPDVNVPSLLHRSRTISEELAAVVRRLLEDPHINGPAKEEKIKDVLELSDEVGMLVKRIFAISDSPSSTSPTNVSSPTFAEGKTTPTDDDTLDLTSDSVEVVGNGDSISSPNRKDKGKARAPPEPIRHEPVLSPTAVLLRNGEEEDEGGEGELSCFLTCIMIYSSVYRRSRSWVAEEGEVFRKGNILLGPEEMEGEYDGEELRRELLEAMVERPAPRSLHVDDTDDYGSVLTPSALSPTATSPLPSPLSTPLPTPLSPSPASSTLLGPLPEHGSSFDSLSTSSPTTMSVETTATQHAMSSTSSSVRPYIPRTRSSSGTTISTIHG
ncbi:hypothetical protein EV361DRAFT_803173 [Lentinula raphanica]|nr:hypothetical protein F5880DRAFT_1487448 [Lentinula raphanica]KAJ3969800.1 hypothetical protein EV361DRAFT_803173 [Lentinula raphanica]